MFLFGLYIIILLLCCKIFIKFFSCCKFISIFFSSIIIIANIIIIIFFIIILNNSFIFIIIFIKFFIWFSYFNRKIKIFISPFFFTFKWIICYAFIWTRTIIIFSIQISYIFSFMFKYKMNIDRIFFCLN